MRETAARTATLEHEVRTRLQAETDARNAQARNDAILNVALDCVLLMDEMGRIVHFNPAAERTFGYSATEAVGTELAELIVPCDAAAAHQGGLARYLTSGRGLGVEPADEVVRRPQGRRAVSGGGGHRADLVRRTLDVRRATCATSPSGSESEQNALARYTQDLEEAHNTERQNAEQLAKLVEELRVTQGQAEPPPAPRAISSRA